MMLSDISVRRPVFAAVAAIILCVVGLASFSALTVRELPSVDPPVVGISTNYRGASAEVIEERITEVIERQAAGIEGIDRVQSSSRDGSSRINISFKLDRDLDAAANDVRDAVSRVTAQLPEQADPPQIQKANADSSPIMFLNFTSQTMDRLQLSDYAQRYLVERLSTVPGVATVGVGGSQIYSMRIWLNPDAMAARGITVEDVETALTSQNAELPAGSLEAPAKDFTIRVARGYATPEQFSRMPIVPTRTASTAQASAALGGAAATAGAAQGATRDVVTASAAQGYITRLGDIARVEEGPDERRRLFRSNGKDMVGIAITRQSQANDLEISDGVRAAIKEINATLPKGTQLGISVDYTQFTRHAIQEVWVTMAISLACVALVNFLFLGTWRAAMIPSIVAPICILSTFIVLAPLGFSINLLTLLALVLAIGLVVDDAIVVVENIQRRIDEGNPDRRRAARRAAGVLRSGGDHHRADLGVRAVDVPAGLHRPPVRRAGRLGGRGRGLFSHPGPVPLSDAGVQAAASRPWRGLAGASGRWRDEQAEELVPRFAGGDAGPPQRLHRGVRPGGHPGGRRVRRVQRPAA